MATPPLSAVPRRVRAVYAHPSRVQPSQGMPLPKPNPRASAPTPQRRNRKIASRYALRSALAHSRSRAPLRGGAHTLKNSSRRAPIRAPSCTVTAAALTRGRARRRRGPPRRAPAGRQRRVPPPTRPAPHQAPARASAARRWSPRRCTAGTRAAAFPASCAVASSRVA